MARLLVVRPRISAALVIVGLAVCASLTHHRALAWQSNRALWIDALSVNPHSAFARWRLGTVEFQRGAPDIARDLVRGAFSDLHPGDPIDKFLWLWSDILGR